MKLIRVKKKDEVDNPVGDLVVEICKTRKWFGNKNYLVYFACYGQDEIEVNIVGPQEGSAGTHGDLDAAKTYLKNIKQSEKDLEQAIAYAEKTKKDFEKRMKEVAK